MRYQQVYNTGPLEEKEPLYHSAPFFMRFNGEPDENIVYGLFIDNPAQTCIDIGHSDNDQYLLGTRFGDMDYYFLLGENATEVMSDFTAIVGRSRLRPRYILGYHQGCYGYEDEGALRWVTQKYREHDIPFDGLHIDVDIQDRYRTFTIKDGFCDVSKDPNDHEESQSSITPENERCYRGIGEARSINFLEIRS
uniref:Alpha-glucosidase n=1 Tax=Candidatus Kentrum sp. MB TaxID=2138164 RepID=A0A450XMF1_9GAMM|nr:MAG: alpha-glucosidase [Candidatus Kentron sp. MB]VFK34402.1 MAG: alpha-glucosidase [Candidatus Kentron sp. MB]VFK76717.1 MAG: alpha-glucosidase [Candidatus Kentron sp. MB]